MKGSQSDTDRAQINVVDAREKKRFKAHAISNDDSMSSWAADACRERLRRESVATELEQHQVQHRLYTAIEQAGEDLSNDILAELAPAVTEEVLRQLAAADVVPERAVGIDPDVLDDDLPAGEQDALEFPAGDRPELSDGDR